MLDLRKNWRRDLQKKRISGETWGKTDSATWKNTDGKMQKNDVNGWEKNPNDMT